MTALEQTLLSILRELLDEPEMDASDDFYAMGGDSLSALRFITASSERGVTIELRDILYFPTVVELAAALDDPARTRPHCPREETTKVEEVILTLPEGVEQVRPASELQLSLIYLSEAAQDSTLYHDLVGFEVLGPFENYAFLNAMRVVCTRHEMLRSSFDLADFPKPVRLVWAAQEPLVIVERTDDAAETTARWRKYELARTIDVAVAPLMRCHVAVGPDTFYVTLALHHAIIDGWSLSRILTELLMLYSGALDGTAVALPPVPDNGYSQFVALESQAVGNNETAAYWRREAGVPPMLFDRAAHSGPSDPAERMEFPIGADAFAGLRDAAARIGVPLKCLVLACHARALGGVAGRTTDVVTGISVNGRPETPDADHLVGLFVNTVPLRFPSTAGDLADVARSALDLERAALPHRRYPLVHINHALGRPAYDVMFNYTHFHAYDRLKQVSTKTRSWWSFDKTSIPFVVDFMVEPHGGNSAVGLRFDRTLLAPDIAERYATSLGDVLRQAGGVGS